MIILCADDYGMTQGVSRAIGELAAARRLSATSVMTTSSHWPTMAPRLLVHRPHLAIGLHVNLTLGAPLGAMPRLAPGGEFPTVGRLIGLAALWRLDVGEIRAEIERQLDRFEQGMHSPPDHVDGHQHVHVLPRVRQALLEALTRRYRDYRPLLRLPGPAADGAAPPGFARLKASTVGLLGLGFESAARRRGFPMNDSFAGFSDFDVDQPYESELEIAFLGHGRRHIIMCHPGHTDPELARVDPVVTRRRMEYDVLMRAADLPARIWRPDRRPDAPPVNWQALDRRTLRDPE